MIFDRVPRQDSRILYNCHCNINTLARLAFSNYNITDLFVLCIRRTSTIITTKYKLNNFGPWIL